MINKQEIKLINSLKRKKNRVETGLFIVEGEKNVTELLESDFIIKSIYATEDWKSDVKHQIVSNKDLERISGLTTPNKVLAVVEQKKYDVIDVNQTSLVIDQVNDPGNLGTIIRTADWFGIDQVICSADSVDCYNLKTVMSSMGSVFRTKVFYKDLTELFETHSLPVYGALLKGKSLYETKFESPSFLLLGSESHGISNEILPYIHHQVTIPGNGEAESLNLGISTALFASEYYRQKL